MAQERIGVFICNCGTNIAKVVDAQAVATAVQDIPGVASARSYKYMCSNPGQEMIADDIRKLGLTKVVVAACSPRVAKTCPAASMSRRQVSCAAALCLILDITLLISTVSATVSARTPAHPDSGRSCFALSIPAGAYYSKWFLDYY
jgi:hypothetical protein